MREDEVAGEDRGEEPVELDGVLRHVAQNVPVGRALVRGFKVEGSWTEPRTQGERDLAARKKSVRLVRLSPDFDEGHALQVIQEDKLDARGVIDSEERLDRIAALKGGEVGKRVESEIHDPWQVERFLGPIANVRPEGSARGICFVYSNQVQSV